MKIGMKAPAIRVPCIFNNQFSFLSLSNFQKKKFALCCLPDLKETDAWFLEAQAQEFEQSGSGLVILASNDNVLGRDWVRPPQNFGVPFFIDPINRLQKALRLSASLRPNRCETLIFDHNTQLRFRLIHDLTLKDISSVLDISEANFVQNALENVAISRKEGHQGILQTTDFKTAIEIPS